LAATNTLSRVFFGCLARLAALLMVFTAGALVGACNFTRLDTTVPPAVIGQIVRDGTFDFTVTQVNSSRTFGTARAQGVYVIVTLTVKNVGVDPEVFDRSAQLLEDSTERRYSTSFMDPPYLGDIGNSVDAGLQVNVKLAFDVPPGTKPTQIVLHESQSSDGIPVNLMQPPSPSPSPPRG
jgi:Domain of unknown function (DUF4352)